MMIKKNPTDIYNEYLKGNDYNTSIDLLSNVEKNERFYMGDHWNGVNAPDMIKPVFNMIKRIVTYFVAMIVSDDIGIKISPFDETEESLATTNILTREIMNVIENIKFKEKNREIVRNGCVDGDAAFYFNFDSEYDTGHNYKGRIECSIVDNTNLIFGNPYDSDIQKQPYVIVQQRLYTNSVKEMAKNLGVEESLIENIVSDDDYVNSTDRAENENLTTVLTKFWKETRYVDEVDSLGLPNRKKFTTVHYTKTTKDVTLVEDTDLGYELYPISYFTWEKVKRSYHGRSPITGIIPNQIFVNKLFAMCMVYVTNMGFPKVLYDSTKFNKAALKSLNGIKAQNLDLIGKFMDAAKAPDFSNQITQLISDSISYTKEFMGANDAALGNVRPENTSAIIALQEANGVPLQLQKMGFYEFVEDSVRIILDIMSNNYGIRQVKITTEEAEKMNLYQSDPNGQEVLVTRTDLDFSLLKKFKNEVNVSVGESSYWSELMNIQTMDNLFAKGIVANPVDYLESVPDKYLTNKQKLIDSLKSKQNEADQVGQLLQVLQQALEPEVYEQIVAQLNMDKAA